MRPGRARAKASRRPAASKKSRWRQTVKAQATLSAGTGKSLPKPSSTLPSASSPESKATLRSSDVSLGGTSWPEARISRMRRKAASVLRLPSKPRMARTRPRTEAPSASRAASASSSAKRASSPAKAKPPIKMSRVLVLGFTCNRASNAAANSDARSGRLACTRVSKRAFIAVGCASVAGYRAKWATTSETRRPGERAAKAWAASCTHSSGSAAEAFSASHASKTC
mmetsp:Transcript_2695/g.8084  ORF Transcript_2695/g.8084 Transcript_2695/m.8084 type:complete len:226 (+) Transcript_2695:883-1560(+)